MQSGPDIDVFIDLTVELLCMESKCGVQVGVMEETVIYF